MKLKLSMLLLLMIGGARAQSISPFIAECGQKCSGEFTVTNTSVKPAAVVLDLFTLKIVKGKEVLLPLDQNTTVALNETSARLSPQGEHTYGYKVFCNQESCLTRIRVGMPAGKTKDGMLVMLRLPYTVYSCKKQKGCRAKVLAEQQ